MSAPFLAPRRLIAGLTVLLAAVVALGSTTSARAQQAPAGSTPSFPTAGVSVFIDGVKQKQANVLYINKKQCEQMNSGTGVQIEIQLANLSASPASGGSTPMVLESWVGISSYASGAQDCTKGASRQNTATTQSGTGVRTVCTEVSPPQMNIDGRNQILRYSANQLFSGLAATATVSLPAWNAKTVSDNFNSTPSKPTPCTLQNSQSLYIVPLQNPTPTTGMPADSSGTGFEIKFIVDVVPLNAPTGASAGSGNTQVGINWTVPSGANTQTSYNIYYDTKAISHSSMGTCSSETLMPGKALPVDPSASGLEQASAGRGNSTTADPQALGLQTNEQIPGAVVAVDVAGNESPVSNIFCVKRVATVGFWDACQADKNCKNGFHTCSVSFGEDRSGWLGWSLSVLGLALWMRRRRTV